MHSKLSLNYCANSDFECFSWYVGARYHLVLEVRLKRGVGRNFEILSENKVR